MDSSNDKLYEDVKYSEVNSNVDVPMIEEDKADEHPGYPILNRDTFFYSNEALDTKAAAELVFNVNKCVIPEKCSTNIPNCPPDADEPKFFNYVVPYSPLLRPTDCNTDALCPWWAEGKNATTSRYFVKIENNGNIWTKKVTARTVLQPGCIVMKKYYIRHRKFNSLTKSVFRCESDTGLALQKDTFVVIMYTFTEPTKLYSQGHGNPKLNRTPLVHNRPVYVITHYQHKLTSNIPLYLRQNLDDKQRKEMEQRGIELSKFCLYNKEGTVRAVVDKDGEEGKQQRFATMIDLTTVPIYCGCLYLEKGQQLCEHIIAACYAIKDFAPLDKQEAYFKNAPTKEAIPVYWNENSFELFKLKETRNARKCSSCDISFDKESTELLDSHVIVHIERSQSPNEDDETVTCNYIHSNLECIMQRYPFFIKELLKFSNSITDEEREIFIQHFNT